MPPSLGAAEFFALEAGEYLERLGSQIAQADGPAPDEFMRFSRALRGSALMAKQSDIANAAAGLEAIARQYREGTLRWSPAVREIAGQAVEDLKLLVRAAGSWDDEHRQRAQRVGQALESVGGIASTQAPSQPAPSQPPGPTTLSTGVRAFVAREGALIASALDRAATVLRVQPNAKDPLNTVIRRLHSLRGLAELGELPPLPGILDGIELACAELGRAHAPPPDVAAVFDAAAHAVTRIARDVANDGRTAPDASEGRRFTELLNRAFVAEEDVVSIAALAPADGEPQVRERGTRPTDQQPGSPTPMELTGHAEHLLAMAAELRGTESALERDLRLVRVFDALRALSHAPAHAFAGSIRDFGRAARAHIASGNASRAPDAFSAMLDEAGRLLRDRPGETDEAVTERLGVLIERLTRAEPAAPVAEPAPPTAEPGGDIVPIGDLAPDDEAVPLAVSPDVPGMRSDLATSFVTFARLMQQSPHAEPSLDAFLGRPTGSEPEAAVVPITTLLYSGSEALDRATAIREQMRDLLARDEPWESMKPLVEELLDLVPLARGAAS